MNLISRLENSLIFVEFNFAILRKKTRNVLPAKVSDNKVVAPFALIFHPNHIPGRLILLRYFAKKWGAFSK